MSKKTTTCCEEDMLLIEAAHNYAYRDWREDSICSIAYYAYKAGAKWERKQFLDKLWHSFDEEPEKNKTLLGYDVDGYAIYKWADQEQSWQQFVSNTALQKWCYIEDLTVKKGDEE